MTKKDNMPNPEEHVHECDGEDCDHDHESNVITLDMEDGSQKDFMVLDMLQHEGMNYVALSEVGQMEYDILRFEEMEENLELSIIEDDDEYERIAKVFEERFASMMEMDEMEEE
jgi:uncharacterized protein YrzB (UPF0473 family)